MLVFCKGPNILKNLLAKKLKGVKLAYLKHLIQLPDLLWSSQNNYLASGLQYHIGLGVDDIFPIGIYISYYGTAGFSSQVQIAQGMAVHLIGKILNTDFFQVCCVLPFNGELVQKGNQIGHHY